MPYIKKERREKLDPLIGLLRQEIESWGECNYVITCLIQSMVGAKTCYESCQSAIGLLECIKQEFSRRVVAPYEDKKKKENGDVYETT